MSFIQVPIGKGIGKFPKLRFSQPEFEKKSTISSIPQSDLQFLRGLAEDSRIVVQTNTGTTSGDMITITPDTGTTFFFLGASVTNTDGAAAGTFQLTNDGTIRDFVQIAFGDNHTFTLPIDRIVGNMSRSFILEALTANVNSLTTLYGWNENTERIS